MIMTNVVFEVTLPAHNNDAFDKGETMTEKNSCASFTRRVGLRFNFMILMWGNVD